MKDVYFAGDSYALTGPSIVNKYYRELLGHEFTFAKAEKNPVVRLLGAAKNVFTHKVLIISGASKYDYAVISLGKLLRKKVIYIMHGCMEAENVINRAVRADETRLERFYLNTADRILCVSEQFARWVRENYPKYREKVFPLTNGVDWEIIQDVVVAEHRDPRSISIVGGGVPRKNVKSVCEAVDKINRSLGVNYELKVFGRDDLDTDAVKAYPFVRYFGKIERKRLFEEIAGTSLFIQNSIFDSFAMAPLEALLCGCSILCSKNVGALSLFKTAQDQDVIEDCFDSEEIKGKILYTLANPNHNRLLEGLDKEETSFANRAQQLKEYVNNLIKD